MSQRNRPAGTRKAPSKSGRRRRLRWAGIGLGVVLGIGFLLPGGQVIPVQGASEADWNHDTFWYHPWGRSGVHKGIDIFAAEGTPVVASTAGVVVHSGELSRGGNVVVVLGPRWRFHYYAHLATRAATAGTLLGRGDAIGTVGTTGNAAGKPPHLHYAIVTAVPYPWRISREPQGWKKMLYLDPDEALRKSR